MGNATDSSPGVAYWVISALALAWNLLGVASYLAQLTVSSDALGGFSEAERLLHRDAPGWADAAVACAVFAGALGSIALLLRQSWSVVAFAVSLCGVIVQLAHSFLMTDTVAVGGTSAIVLPILVTIIAIYLALFARASADNGKFRRQ